jgi:hypothetical protein
MRLAEKLDWKGLNKINTVLSENIGAGALFFTSIG